MTITQMLEVIRDFLGSNIQISEVFLIGIADEKKKESCNIKIAWRENVQSFLVFLIALKINFSKVKLFTGILHFVKILVNIWKFSSFL